jgi:C-8 sterol isomerase
MGYVFDPDQLAEIALKGVGLPFEEMCEAVISEAARVYPKHIETKQEWVFNLASGATGIMNVLHGSLTEYLIIFGTPIGTEAFSGRYPLEIYDYMLAGTMATYKANDPGHAKITRAGEWAPHPFGAVNGFAFEPNTWALEYGRGFVPGALHTTMGDLIFRALDPLLLGQTFKVYGRLTLKELLQGKI